MQNVVPRLTGTPGEVRWTGPKLGEHNEEVYGELLKLDGDERSELLERGII
jgi:crotonobetainyl-CoA:carnitine CoA-transferase CaiB-like acyl-CoA transferase